MTIRPATEGDAPVLRELWQEFEREVPEPPHQEETWEEVWEEMREYLREGIALIVEEDGSVAGYALAKIRSPKVCYLSDLYVRARWRRRGIAKALIRETVGWAIGRGASTLTLEVTTSNTDARMVYERLGFAEESRNLFTPLAVLGQRLDEGPRGESYGGIHVQTDDAEAVARAVRQFVPRLPGGSRGSVVVPTESGWTAVHDELCDREPAMLRRLATELSDRMGAVVLTLGVEDGEVVRYVLLERGSVVDEYLSVPDYHGPLPPGDVIALGANPTVASRLTGADPSRVREVARTARSPVELPPADELLAALAALLGVKGPGFGFRYAQAREQPGAILLDRDR